MRLAPRYNGPTVVTIDDPAGNQLAPFVSQRARFESLLAGLTDDQWAHQSRCDEWTVRDVIAHLVSVNQFWHLSVVSGLAGRPTTYLAEFDPAATPRQLVESMGSVSPSEVLDQFVATNAALVSVLSDLAPADWATLCETPAGHVPIQILTQHGLWDSWIHERDIAIPLGLPTAVDAGEVVSCLRFAAAISPVLGLGLTGSHGDAGAAPVVGVVASDPTTEFSLTVTDHVKVGNGPIDRAAPCLRGDAVTLAEALSLRVPLPDDAPPEWRTLLGSLVDAFTPPAAG